MYVRTYRRGLSLYYLYASYLEVGVGPWGCGIHSLVQQSVKAGDEMRCASVLFSGGGGEELVVVVVVMVVVVE